MDISTYWVDQIPQRPMAIEVRNSSGQPLNLSSYTSFNVILMDSKNEAVDLTGSELATAGAIQGRFVFRFPTDRSVFERDGDYLLQLEMSGEGARDFTTAHPIRVRKLGGIN